MILLRNVVTLLRQKVILLRTQMMLLPTQVMHFWNSKYRYTEKLKLNYQVFMLNSDLVSASFLIRISG